ncbi:uncharacterized protein CXQ87_002629 [Candidozyma duobushaemuli]|uniref:THUMP domain-containing protein n=2 Tax=Candidozyma TaxID=3303203 RepID=A0ABX8I282_9ASCO|nr:uncharacterized protein CXQ87_002629 [[Candida] duobushaemulonis]PVH14488.1 hypothetical protein CXQ87_002629 [[Candida] duobushaemulonis]QWU87346.1 hypothetical protein CA3LBN_001611 [[Candida] haemuloni]
MGKRGGESQGGNRNKKYKQSGFIDPNTAGVYATCNRGRELGCRKELLNLLSEKCEQWYPDWESKAEVDDEDDKDLSVEEQVQKELASMKKEKTAKSTIFSPIDLSCECTVFVKIRKPVEPAEFIHRICQEAKDSGVKKSRFIQKLTPVTFSVSASLEEIKKLAAIVLKPHFHKEEGQEPLKFAIQVTRRNFNQIPKEEIIQTVAGCVGKDHGHTVDLKKYDKLILVDCFKSNIGMSVVSDYLQLEKFNLQQIFEKNMKDSKSSRVNPESNSDKKDIKEESDDKKDIKKEDDATKAT